MIQKWHQSDNKTTTTWQGNDSNMTIKWQHKSKMTNLNDTKQCHQNENHMTKLWFYFFQWLQAQDFPKYDIIYIYISISIITQVSLKDNLATFHIFLKESGIHIGLVSCPGFARCFALKEVPIGYLGAVRDSSRVDWGLGLYTLLVF